MSDEGSGRLLVTGATGYVGGHLVASLVERGRKVRALARNPDKLRNVPWHDQVEVVRGDLSDPESLVAAFADVDVLYYLVHSMGTSTDFVKEEESSAQNVAAAAKKAGVRRIVYLSGLHPTGHLSRHLESRNTVAKILIESGVETVVLQAGIVIGSGSASFEMVRHLTDRLPVMTTPKWVRNKIQPISVVGRAATTSSRRPKLPRCPSHAPSTSALAGRAGVRRRDAGLRRGRGTSQACHRCAAAAHPKHRELVGGAGDADPVGVWRARWSNRSNTTR